MRQDCWTCKHYDQKFQIYTTGVLNVSGQLAKFIRWDKHRCSLKQEDRYPNNCDFELNHEKVAELNEKYPDLAAMSEKSRRIRAKLDAVREG